MSALTNIPLRELCEAQGCGFTTTEFLPAAALAAKNRVFLAKIAPTRLGRRFGVQLYGRVPRRMAKAAAIAVKHGAALVDINMGCPTRKVTRGACGSALMREPELAAQLVEAACDGAGPDVPVTVKMRSGWDASDRTGPDFARLMVDVGAAAVTIHGRTREQGFSGKVDLEAIARVKEAFARVGIETPVIANGDIVDVHSLERTLAQTGADGVMIGRGALGNPWVFAQLKAWYQKQELFEEVDGVGANRRVQKYWEHLQLYQQIAPQERAVLEMRKFARWYLAPAEATHSGLAQVRQAILQMTSAQEIEKALRQSGYLS